METQIPEWDNRNREIKSMEMESNAAEYWVRLEL